MHRTLSNTIKNGANSLQERALLCDQTPSLLFSKEDFLQLIPSPLLLVISKATLGLSQGVAQR